MKLTDLPLFKEELDEFKLTTFIGDQVVYLRNIFEQEKTKSHIPMIIVRAIRRGSMEVETVVIGLADLPEERHQMVYQVGEHFSQQYIPICAVMFSEAWMVTVTDGKMPDVAPSKHPDKEEVMAIALVTIEMKSKGCVYRIARDQEQYMSLGERITPESEDAQVDGRLLKEFFRGAMASFMKDFTRPA